MAGATGDENSNNTSGGSRYVKLVKEQDAPLEDIQPGELNQPVHVPQLVVHRCGECGQPLPESYEPPRNEPWTTGICGCTEDSESCWQGVFCPCVLFGKNFEALKEDVPWTTPCTCHAIFVEGGIALALATSIISGINPRAVVLVAEGLLFSWWMCGIYTGLFRQELQRKYHLQQGQWALAYSYSFLFKAQNQAEGIEYQCSILTCLSEDIRMGLSWTVSHAINPSCNQNVQPNDQLAVQVNNHEIYFYFAAK